MKKFVYMALAFAMVLSSCEDMISVDSDRALHLPEINQKSDSLFYAWGIMQAMQQAADMYVLQNEMRGDLVKTTPASHVDLRSLADYSATAANSYDSVYVYYKVINNCNYYLAHRDTTLYNGSYHVTQQEYAAVLAFRAWAYLQAARTYGKVRFYTEPKTNIGSALNDQSPMLGMADIVRNLAPQLEQYTGTAVPSYANIDAGLTNQGKPKTIISSQLYIPVDVILGEMYLETGEWQKAAEHYAKYLVANDMNSSLATSRFACQGDVYRKPADYVRPSDLLQDEDESSMTGVNWKDVVYSKDEIITYIPMAVNRLNGKTTQLPRLFGYNYYATADQAGQAWLEPQIEPSEEYNNLADSAHYYYYNKVSGKCGETQAGDMRRNARMTSHTDASANEQMFYPSLYVGSNDIILYRKSTVWLHLAEALNRMGYPDAAFMILKDGVNARGFAPGTLGGYSYLGREAKEFLTSPSMRLVNAAKTISSKTGNDTIVYSSMFSNPNYGIHAHGCADEHGLASSKSLYTYDRVMARKLAELAAKFQIQAASDASGGEYSLKDSINAMEDILCDEYAMEFAFEGTRAGDLLRMARHKNESGIYGGGFGSRWLAYKFRNRQLAKDLADESSWYLPFE